MKEKIQAQLQAVLPRLLDAVPEHIQVERTKQKAHGDFATNVALVCGKKAGMAPRAFAEQLMALIDAPEWLVKMEIAGPGFINFFVAEQTQLAVIDSQPPEDSLSQLLLLPLWSYSHVSLSP